MPAARRRRPLPLRELTREVVSIPTVAYLEGAVVRYLRRFAAERGLDCSQDVYGNVSIIYRRGRRRRPLLLGAHIDHPGFVVTAVKGRRLTLEGDERPTVTSPADIARLLQAEMELLQQEELRLLVLDTKHHVLAAPTLYRGSVNSSPARVAEMFREAVRHNAAAIAVVHIHPSGDPTPSSDDVALTTAVVQAGELLDVDVLDHVVFGHGRYVSMRERHLGFD